MFAFQIYSYKSTHDTMKLMLMRGEGKRKRTEKLVVVGKLQEYKFCMTVC